MPLPTNHCAQHKTDGKKLLTTQIKNVDHTWQISIIVCVMEADLSQKEHLQLLTELERRVNGLLGEHNRLMEENLTLKQQQEKLSSEKASLHDKQRQVQSKLESMLTRLKSLEQQ